MQTVQAENMDSPAPMATEQVDRRAFRRVRVPLKVRYMLDNGGEYPARVRTISPASAVIDCDRPAAPGDHILLYIDRIGRLEGKVTTIEPGAMRVEFIARRARLARNADILIWLVNRGTQDQSARRAVRIRQDKAAAAIGVDGSQNDCRILDISVSGASVAIDPKPPIGTVLSIGKMKGRVVRHHDAGVGIEFISN